MKCWVPAHLPFEIDPLIKEMIAQAKMTIFVYEIELLPCTPIQTNVDKEDQFSDNQVFDEMGSNFGPLPISYSKKLFYSSKRAFLCPNGRYFKYFSSLQNRCVVWIQICPGN